jgi:hypothetical protein
MIVDLEHKTRDGVRFKHSDKEWLQDTVNFLILDGFPKVAKMLQEEVDKL